MIGDTRSVVRGPSARLGWIALAVAAWVAVFGTAPQSGAQPVEPFNGPRQIDPAWHALVRGTAVPAPGERIEHATIVIRDGVIVSIEAGGAPPEGALVHDCTGLTIYAGLIDPYVPVDAPRPDAKAPGRHWNSLIMAERSALDGDGLSNDARKTLRAMGYTVAGIAPRGGVLRGRSAVVSLGEHTRPGSADARVLASSVFDVAAFETTGRGDRGYPGSQMGAIALLRQTLADAAWYARAVELHAQDPARHPRPEANDSLAALGDVERARTMLFDVDDELQALRAAKVGGEFERELVIVGSGFEFRRLDAIIAIGTPLILPVTRVPAPSVERPGDRDAVTLRDLMTWEQQPTNLRRLHDAGANVAITTSKRKRHEEKADAFWSNVRDAIKHGLAEEDALAMMTTVPAAVLGMEDRIGLVRPGFAANLLVVKGGLFEKDRKLQSVWVDGKKYELEPSPRYDLAGAWRIVGSAGETSFTGTISIDTKGAVKLELPGTVEEGAEEPAKPRTIRTANAGVRENRVSFTVSASDIDAGAGRAMVWGTSVGDRMLGVLERSDGNRVEWLAVREVGEEESTPAKENEEKPETAFEMPPDALPLPLGAYGHFEPSPPIDLIITNATIWTCGPEGIIENGALVMSEGRIVYVGPASRIPRLRAGVPTIDATGKHITPGLIDCHSHTGISGGVNESGQAVTAEVRIADVVNPDDVGWYRQLAGGLTAANQLHGSANPIGGQNSVVKLRWGVSHPDEMRMRGAVGGIKFALGENVKQSNWGDNQTTRYPQTRMGVETLMRDRFIAAREYAAAGTRGGVKALQRRDLELEALAEILADRRLVHCHSYRQDEILMLCRVAEEFGFTIGTFQHVLEGYKVAEAIRDHSLGGSSFSDWWAYKFEVFDAIPSNGAIMHDMGVTVSFNSDSDELARRMNTEATKAVKYGGVPPEEALKFVTLNPAKQLRVDRWIGSLEVGKDADVVIWSGDPLSTLTRCEATYVDGREMFSLERDAELRSWAEAERQRIIQKVLAQGAPAERRTGGRSDRGQEAADTELVDTPPWLRIRLEMEYEWMIMNGMNPYATHCGDCGCALHDLFKSN